MSDLDQSEPDYLATFAQFISASPTSYHAAHNIAELLNVRGFTQLDEASRWGAGSAAHYVIRDGGLIAWRAPENPTDQTGLRIVATHDDSPALKLKPSASFKVGDYTMADVEVYGGPQLQTWLDRELLVAGRLIDNQQRTILVRTDPIMRISTLAPHLTRQAGVLELDRQQDLAPVFETGPDARELREYLCEAAGVHPDAVLGADLFVVPSQEPAVFGSKRQYFASYRLDNLASVYSGLFAFLRAEASHDVQVFAAFDHEEIGSGTISGAQGPFLGDVLTRIGTGLGFDADAQLAWRRRGSCLSADVAHAVHPTRPGFYDPRNFPVLDGGPVLKINASGRYGTEGWGEAIWRRACQVAGVPTQVFVNNNTIAGGTSVGPLVARQLGVRTVDVGTAIAAMHSAREMCGTCDPQMMSQAMGAYWAGV